MFYLQILISTFFILGCQHARVATTKINERTVQLEVLGSKGQVILNKKITIDDRSQLIAVTTQALQESKIDFKTQVLCGEEGLSEVANLKTQEIKLKKNHLKSYGWCYFIDDQLFEIIPGKFDMKQVKGKITWAYAYSEKRNKKWTGQCVKDH